MTGYGWVDSSTIRASRRLDTQIAERVFGLPVVWAEEPYIIAGRPRKEGLFPYLKGRGADGVMYDWANLPRYSSSIDAAWRVIEALAAAPHHIAMTVSTLAVPHAICTQDSKQISEAWIAWDGVPDSRTQTERCALAICIAALRALGVDLDPSAPEVASTSDE